MASSLRRSMENWHADLNLLLPPPERFRYPATVLRRIPSTWSGVAASLRAAAGGVLCALLIVCGAVSADEGRHRQLHTDDHGHGHSHDHDADGTCAICLLIAGGCDLTPAPGVPAVIATGFSLEWAAVCDAPSARSVRTVRSDRGPPTDRA